MSRHDYSQYSNNKKHHDGTATIPVSYQGNMCVVDEFVEPDSFATTISTPAVEMVVETVETMTLPETVVGVVANCNKLNVRVAPDATADVACVLNAGTEIEVNVTDSTDEWFSVCTAAGIEGYCMRKFVNTRV